MILALLLSCGQGEDDPVAAGPEVCDAGDTTWVQRVTPLLWGRRPHGAYETQLWADLARDEGRDVVVRAMTASPEYIARWRDQITDFLYVARTGDRDYGACFASPLLPEDTGALARWLATAPAAGAPYANAFNMADVVRSALQADDLSAAWRVNLYARMNRPMNGANVGPEEMEESRRQAFGETFDHTYINRDLVCLGCHNGEYSTTDDPDPAEDRFWQVPGLFEKAIFGSSFGLDEATAFQVWRYADLMTGDQATAAPWGIDPSCGRFSPDGSMPEDYLDHDGYFIEAFGEAGSVWQVEAFLQVGVDTLADRGLVLGDDGLPDGPDAFAWLVAQNITDEVWKEAMGERLTIATYFPRNEAQRDRLQALTAHFVAGRFSLRELLVDVLTDPYYNAGAPETCAADPYGMSAVLNPWSNSDEDAAKRGNGAGDLVHRHAARVLIHSVHDTMGWPQPDAFLAGDDPLFSLQGALGAFLRESQPGFSGTDFQGALAFESTYGSCQPPDVGGAGNGCAETLGYAGCASCTCQSCACAVDPYCCDVQWDALCVSICNDDCGGCGGGLAEDKADVLDRLLANARTNDATVRDVVLGLKDRLVARGSLTDGEEALIASLLGAPLDTKLSALGDIEANFRVLCGAILLSPDYFLSIDGGPIGPVPAATLDADVDCVNAADLLASQGVTVSCAR